MKIDQIAFYCQSKEEATKLVKQLGLLDANWIEDRVTARSIVNGVEGRNVAELAFNYDRGIELEILRYVEGPSWHDTNPLFKGEAGKPFVSHIGIHLEDDEDFPPMESAVLVQETFTESHTAEYLTKEGSPGYGRTYHYRIFELSPGSYVKYIKRIHPKKEAA